jgi:hypothetical protein
MYIDILHLLRDAFRRKCPEKMRTNSWSLFHDNAPAHQSVSVKDLLAKNNVTNTGASPMPSWPSSSWLLTLRMRRKSWQCFTKCLPGMFPTLYSRSQRCIIAKGGMFWRKFSLNAYNVLYFSEKKWYGEYFEATKFLPLGFKGLITNGNPDYHNDSYLHKKIQKFDDMFNSQIRIGTRNPVFYWSEMVIIWEVTSNHNAESVDALTNRVQSILTQWGATNVDPYVLHKIPVCLCHTAGFELNEAESLPP